MASAVWKGHVPFGLVSFPAKLFAAARSESVSFNQLHKADGSRIKQVLDCRSEDRPVQRREIVKGYEYEKGSYVVVEDEKIQGVAPGAAGEKPYAVLFEALRRTGYAGIAKLAMHNREHIVILRPGPAGLVLHTMYYAGEVRKADEFRTDTSMGKEKELEPATMLVETPAAAFEPDKYRDTRRDNLMALIEAKVQGKERVEAPPVEPSKVPDILEALKQSLSIARKPPASGSQASPAAGTQDVPAPEAPPARARRRRASREDETSGSGEFRLL